MIYLIAAHEVALCKIGTARDVGSRLSTLQTACPFDLTIVATREGDHVLERHIQAQLLEFRVRGEWFQYAPAVVTAFHESVLASSAPNENTARQIGSVVAIIDELGGTAEVARKLGIPLTTVATWRQKNSVPHYRRASLSDLKAGPVRAVDFA